MKKKSYSARKVQFVWGVALLMMGLGVFIRTPSVMPRVAEAVPSVFAQSFFRYCMYLIGAILICGGIGKIVQYFKTKPPRQTDTNN
ncbi:MAG: hypothetical protein GY874_06320 [Desulfobacteraceae bacterium]|nr:hypothetical protein [Desulfobacteraceae bacterium]